MQFQTYLCDYIKRNSLCPEHNINILGHVSEHSSSCGQE